MIGVLVFAVLVAAGLLAYERREDIVRLLLALLTERAEGQVNEAYRQARRDMNAAANQSWRDLAG